MNADSEGWDVFISYASEDREEVAGPLAEALKGLGMRVWFDRFELKIGDSLRERIDDGLSRSRFGVLILSPAFFSKHWPKRELNGLAQREVAGQKVILPVWHEVDDQVVRTFSPPLADRVALLASTGAYQLAFQIAEVVRPELAEEARARAAKVLTLARIRSGKELCRIVADAHAFQFFNETASSAAEAKEIAELVQEVQDCGDVWSDLDAGQRVELEFGMHERLESVAQSGWGVYGVRAKRRIKVAGQRLAWEIALIAVIKGEPPAVFVDGERAFVPLPSAKSEDDG